MSSCCHVQGYNPAGWELGHGHISEPLISGVEPDAIRPHLRALSACGVPRDACSHLLGCGIFSLDCSAVEREQG